MNDKERTRMHRAIDNTLSGLKGDPFLAQRIVQRAAQSGEGAKMRNYKWILIVAVVVLMSLTAAVASELFSGTVDWDGNLTPDEPREPVAVPTPTVTVEMAPDGRDELEAAFEEANFPKDGEYVIFYDTHNEVPLSGWNQIRCSVSSLNELAAAVGDALILPINVPEGYVFHEGAVLYGCRPDGEFRLTDVVESEDGFRAEKYTVDAEDRIVIGYELDLRKAGFDELLEAPYVAVYAWLGNGEHDGPAMHLLDVVSTRAASVPGMDKAVAAQGVSISHVEMYANLTESVTVRTDVLEDAQTCFTADYSVWGIPSADELVSMFGGK